MAANASILPGLPSCFAASKSVRYRPPCGHTSPRHTFSLHTSPHSPHLTAPNLPPPPLLQVYFPAEPMDCTDASANIWSGGAPSFAAHARLHKSTDRLDAIAP